jgi:hypothetical protein
MSKPTITGCEMKRKMDGIYWGFYLSHRNEKKEMESSSTVIYVAKPVNCVRTVRTVKNIVHRSIQTFYVMRKELVPM